MISLEEAANLTEEQYNSLSSKDKMKLEGAYPDLRFNLMLKFGAERKIREAGLANEKDTEQ